MRLISVFILTVLLFSCKKKKEDGVDSNGNLQNGLIVLCEGLFQYNNSAISWVDLNSGQNINSMFYNRNGRYLGDTGNDILKYGDKIYIAVSVSSTIEVVRYSDFKSIKQISMINNGVSKEPRSVIGHEGFVFVTCFDGFVDVIDTVSLNVVNRISVGSNPEGMAISNNKLYVSNSGGLNAVMDSTVSVVDLSTQLEIKKIKVGLNPNGIIVDQSGELYVVTSGDYGAIPSRLHRINSATDILEETFGFEVSSVEAMNEKFLVSFYDFDTGQSKISLFNPQNEVVENENYIVNASIETLYGCQFDSERNKIYVFDSKGFTSSGAIFEYSVSGTFLTLHNVGLNPKKIIRYE